MSQTGRDNPVDIADRLEKLNRWQEEQKKMLIERQNLQRKMLSLEQRNLYEVMGMQPRTAEEQRMWLPPLPTPSIAAKPDVQPIIEEPEEEEETTQATSTHKTSGYATEDGQCTNKPKDVRTEIEEATQQKRRFLKRGEGLQQRFKVHPDEFRLDKLPPYPYAKPGGSLTSLRSKVSTRNLQKPKADQPPEKKAPPVPLKPLDAQEKLFQQLLQNGNNACSSTPDTKSSFSNSKSLDADLCAKHSLQLDTDARAYFENQPIKSPHTEQSTSFNFVDNAMPMSWATVLDSQQIKAIPIEKIRAANANESNASDDQNHMESLNFFELLEEYSKNKCFDMDSTCVRKFMNRRVKDRKQQLDERDDLAMSEHLKDKKFQPQVQQVFNEADEEEYSSGSSGQDTQTDYNTTCNTTQGETMTESGTTPSLSKTPFHVRFSDSTQDTTSDLSTMEAGDIAQKYIFQHFKEALQDAMQTRAKNAKDKSVCTDICKATTGANTMDLEEGAQLLKSRVDRLEEEINTFKTNNMQLMKAKQELELEKAHFAQERNDAVARFKDAKIKMEIMLHDEHMKLEDEKSKLEQKMRMMKASAAAAERKEVISLKHEMDELQVRLKMNDQNHIAAKARLQAKVRTMEKDQKQLLDEIEKYRKENKRLENENQRINRENNNKMLNEINRNIAKLAPKLSAPNCTEEATSANASSSNTKMNKPATSKIEKSVKADTKETATKGSTVNSKEKNDGAGDAKRKLNALQVGNDFQDDFKEDSILQDSQEDAKAATTSESYEFRREIINSDGSRDILYPNGNLKKISGDGMNVRMLYFNKDIKEININEGTTKYYYANTNIWQTTYLDGLEIVEYPNGETEHRHKTGKIEVHYPNNSVRIFDPSDEVKAEEWRCPNGSSMVLMRNGDKIFQYPNGQKEMHTKLHKRREYPDGTVKLVYPDGSQETRYSNGRVRLRDKDGVLVMDSTAGSSH